jgi:hypothetical protein
MRSAEGNELLRDPNGDLRMRMTAVKTAVRLST